jgi:hypothetical protein
MLLPFLHFCYFSSYPLISGSPLLLVFSLSKGEHANRGLRFISIIYSLALFDLALSFPLCHFCVDSSPCFCLDGFFSNVVFGSINSTLQDHPSSTL